MTDLYWLRVLEGRLKEKFPGIDVQVISGQTGVTLYAMVPNAVRGVRVFMDGEAYEISLVDVYEREAPGNPSMRTPHQEDVVEFIEDTCVGRTMSGER